MNGITAETLVDTGSMFCHISETFQRKVCSPLGPSTKQIGLAVKGFVSKSLDECEVSVQIGNREYPNVTMHAMDGLRTDVILGRDFMEQHSSVNFHFGGSQPPLNMGSLEALKTLSEPRLFDLTEDCHPILTKSRRYSNQDRKFIAQKVCELLQDGLIQKSNSPWRAQPHVVTGESTKQKRLCIDCSQIINKFTLLDGYPLPNTMCIPRLI